MADRWIEIGFNAPRDVPYVDLYPLDDPHGTVTEVDVNGIQHAVEPGWNRVPWTCSHVSALRVTIDDVRQPQGRGSAVPAAFGRSGSQASTSASCCARR